MKGYENQSFQTDSSYDGIISLIIQQFIHKADQNKAFERDAFFQ